MIAVNMNPTSLKKFVKVCVCICARAHVHVNVSQVLIFSKH